MRKKIILGCCMAILSMNCPKDFYSFQGYTADNPRIICYNTNNDRGEIDNGEDNISTPFCDLPPGD